MLIAQRFISLFRGSADKHLGLAAPQTSHDCVVVVGQALQPASPSPPCPTRPDERLPDPTCLSAEPLETDHCGTESSEILAGTNRGLYSLLFRDCDQMP